MSLYNDLTAVLTPYANKIKQNESDIGDIQDALEHLDVETDKTLSVDGKPADAKATGNAIDKVKADLDKLIVPKTKAIFERGTIDMTNGENTNGGTRIRTIGYIDEKTFRALATTGYEFYVYAYLVNGSYVGCLNASHQFVTVRPIQAVTEYDFSENYRYRLVLKKTDGASITLSDYINISLYYATDLTLTQEHIAADAKQTGDALRSIESIQALAFKSISENTSIHLYEIDDVSQLTSGKLINGQGVIVDEAQSYCTVNPIPVYNGSSFSWKTVVGGQHYGFIYIAFYDNADNYISRSGGSVRDGYESFTLSNDDVPSGAKYCRLTLSYVGIGNVSVGNFIEYYPFEIIKASPKNKWYVLGDSISAGYYSMLTTDVPSGVTPAISYGDGTCSLWDASLSHNYWGYANTWKLKRELVGMAYPGQGYFRTAANSQNGIYVVTHNDFSDAGLITVAWGFNDWHYNQPRGNHDLIDDSVPYPVENYDTTQITTVNQAIWFCLGELIRQAPNAKIVVQTPINGWRYGGDWASNWGIGTALSQSDTLADVHDDIVYWANYYGVQILDMTYNNSIVNRRNIKDTLIDGSHPSDAAHQQLGRHVAMFLGYC